MADYCQRMTIVWTGRPEADQLLEKDPLALLIGLVLDQQVKMEKAFSGPYELKQRLGHLDAGADEMAAETAQLAGDGAGHQLVVPRIVVADALVKRPEEDSVDQAERDDRRAVLADHRPGRWRPGADRDPADGEGGHPG